MIQKDGLILTNSSHFFYFIHDFLFMLYWLKTKHIHNNVVIYEPINLKYSFADKINSDI